MSIANILVVEDEFIVAKDIQNRLKKFGYSVPAIASNAAEAMKKIIDHTPDLVLMDICLRGNVDGVEAAQEIYNNFNIPIVYLTANADDSTLERAKLTEPFGYILKPFKEKELKTTIEIALTKHRTEIKLKESEQWLNTVLKSIGDAVIACDSSGKITFMNPVAEGLTGWKQAEAFGKQTTEVFNIFNEVITLTENPVTHALEKGIIATIPERTKLIAKNGVEIPIDNSTAPLKDERGNITGSVLVFRDISDRQQIEAARQKQIEQERLVAQLEKLNEIKDDFLSTVSHELRTPIANMKMAIQMLKVSGGGANERSQRYLEILQTECNRESDLINDLLDLQRLEAAAYPTFIGEAIDLQQWLPKILEPFRVRTQERQQVIKLDSDQISPLISDRASLERILAELLNNACKYTSANGEIILSVRKQQTNNLETYPSSIQSENSSTLDSFEETRYCVAPTPTTIFTISNQAEVSADQLPRIFDKFYRIPKGDRWKQGGTGLGLALVQKLAEHLQGTISVESNKGWTKFSLQLPDLVVETSQQKIKEN